MHVDALLDEIEIVVESGDSFETVRLRELLFRVETCRCDRELAELEWSIAFAIENQEWTEEELNLLEQISVELQHRYQLLAKKMKKEENMEKCQNRSFGYD